MEIIVLLFFIILGIRIGNWYLNMQAEEKQIEAVLVKKKKISTVSANHHVTSTDYVLIFELEGERKKFIVKRSIYKKYQENDKGLLVFKRNLFVDFIIS